LNVLIYSKRELAVKKFDMKTHPFSRILKCLHKLTKEQYKPLQTQLNETFAQPNMIFENLQPALDETPLCPHCQSNQIIHFGSANHRPVLEISIAVRVA